MRPYIIIAGDFNRHSLILATSDHPDVNSVSTGATRGSATIDLIAVNNLEMILESGTVEPIVIDEVVPTDHRTVYVTLRMPRVPQYDIQKYTYRHIIKEGEAKFGSWLEQKEWPLD